MNRRTFIASAAALAATSGTAAATQTPTGRQRMPDAGSFDPWVEILADAIRNNVRELHRYTGCRLLAVIQPRAVAVATGFDSEYWIMTKLNALLTRKVV